MIELLHQMSDAARPQGIFERLAVQRLVAAWWHFERLVAIAMQRAGSDEAAGFQKNALKWEAVYNRAMRELRLLQTARAILNPAEAPPPMANLKRSPDCKGGGTSLQNQHSAKRTPDQNPDCKGGVADPGTTPVHPTESTICETKSCAHEVGRNSPCPCGSGLKYKRCCGVNAPPILNHAA